MKNVQDKGRDGITICIPNWNHRNFLARSIGSALAASRALAREGIGCEILVIDDHSRDGSQRFLLSIAMMDPTGSVQAILVPDNRGLAASRNLAMSKARYKWICYLDADNELCPGNLASFYRAARDTSATLTYGNLLIHSNENTGICSNEIVHEGILDKNYIDAMAVLDAETALCLGGFDNHPYARTHEDWELILHLIQERCPIVFVPMVLGIYHDIQLSMIKQPDYDHSKMHRMFNQRRVGLPSSFQSRVYHPDLGYLI